MPAVCAQWLACRLQTQRSTSPTLALLASILAVATPTSLPWRRPWATRCRQRQWGYQKLNPLPSCGDGGPCRAGQQTWLLDHDGAGPHNAVGAGLAEHRRGVPPALSANGICTSGSQRWKHRKKWEHQVGSRGHDVVLCCGRQQGTGGVRSWLPLCAVQGWGWLHAIRPSAHWPLLTATTFAWLLLCAAVKPRGRGRGRWAGGHKAAGGSEAQVGVQLVGSLPTRFPQNWLHSRSLHPHKRQEGHSWTIWTGSTFWDGPWQGVEPCREPLPTAPHFF